MDFIISSIVSGIIWDVIKGAMMQLTTKNVFGGFKNETINEKELSELLTTIENKRERISSLSDVKEIVFSKPEFVEAVSKLECKTGFSKRLNYVLTQINEYVEPKKRLNVEKIAKLVGMDSSKEMIDYAEGNAIPSFELENKIAEMLGISVEWLQYENGTISDVIKISKFNASDVEVKADELLPSSIELVYNIAAKDVFVVFGFNEYKYRLISYRVPFRTEIGASGQSQIVEFYNLISDLNKNHKKVVNDTLFIVDYDLEYAVEHEGILPSKAVKNPKNRWYNFVDDFMYLSCSEERRELFRNYYGDDFVFCQDLVRSRTSS
ncbi:MAG: helix-turn-helix transcriptional regulator [Erysipelotrichaceae bacterium]|nr:helix-turn-helix transcriptional regulator [Lachnospiraceae bacterium]MBE6119225.1 helix-turn-helix transcriptional regulator [Erysipelotrichaceae bacterium]